MNFDVILFTSPKAGSGAAREQIPRLVELLSANKISHQVISCPKQLGQLIDRRRETGVSQPIVVAAGGDGTLSLVASKTDPETPLLPMPMGTENLLARHFGHQGDAQSVIKTLTAGRAVRIDAGQANGRLFLIMATAGFDAEVVRRVHLRRKGHIRRSSYLKPIAQTFLAYRFPKIQVTAFDGNQTVVDHREVGWAMAFNLPCYGGGLAIEPDAIGDDGRFDLITFAGRNRISGLGYVLGIFSGTHLRMAGVQRERATRLRFECQQRIGYELDGDYAGRLPLEVTMLPSRVMLMIPE